MGNSFFESQIEKSNQNVKVIEKFETYAINAKKQTYLIKSPFGDKKYIYDYDKAFVLLVPKYKILFIDFGNNKNAFEDYVDDFIEDLSSSWTITSCASADIERDFSTILAETLDPNTFLMFCILFT